jgi:hypothetical protein
MGRESGGLPMIFSYHCTAEFKSLTATLASAFVIAMSVLATLLPVRRRLSPRQ